MAHVQVRQGDSRGTLQVVIDGVDVSNHIYADGFGLVRVGEGEWGQWGVSMIVVPESLDIDLPDAVVTAMRGSDAADA